MVGTSLTLLCPPYEINDDQIRIKQCAIGLPVRKNSKVRISISKASKVRAFNSRNDRNDRARSRPIPIALAAFIGYESAGRIAIDPMGVQRASIQDYLLSLRRKSAGVDRHITVRARAVVTTAAGDGRLAEPASIGAARTDAPRWCDADDGPPIRIRRSNLSHLSLMSRHQPQHSARCLRPMPAARSRAARSSACLATAASWTRRST